MAWSLTPKSDFWFTVSTCIYPFIAWAYLPSTVVCPLSLAVLLLLHMPYLLDFTEMPIPSATSNHSFLVRFLLSPSLISQDTFAGLSLTLGPHKQWISHRPPHQAEVPEKHGPAMHWLVLSAQHKLVSPGKREPQLRDCLHQIGFWANLRGHFLE